jgi:hypothetical protein
LYVNNTPEERNLHCLEAHEAAALVPSEPVAGHTRDRDWKLIVNTDVEAEV